MKLENYVQGQWIAGEGDGSPLIDGANGEIVAYGVNICSIHLIEVRVRKKVQWEAPL